MYSFIAILFILSKSVSTNENITQINKHVPLQFYFHLLIKKPPAQADKYILIQPLALRKQHQKLSTHFPTHTSLPSCASYIQIHKRGDKND